MVEPADERSFEPPRQRPLLNSGSVVVRRWQVTHELAETDETVLFDEQSSELLVLSDPGAAVWYLIDGQRSLGEIARFLEQEAPMRPDDMLEAVCDFVQTLLGRGAIELIGVEASAAPGDDGGYGS